MKNKSPKKIINIIFIVCFSVSLFLFFVFINDVKAQGKQLEINYPTIGGVKPTAANLPQYVKYIFTFFVAIAGLIAFGSLIYAGIRYLTASGVPERIKEARSRIKNTLLGMLILLFSYLILITINPYLTIFQLPKLVDIPYTPAAPPAPSSTPALDVYERIRDIVSLLSLSSSDIECQTNNLRTNISQCDCSNAIAACICKKSSGGMGGAGGGAGGGMGGGGGGSF